MPREKRVSASLYWFGTWNNYGQEAVAPFLASLDQYCDKFVVQEEVGESGTPHLQIKVALKKKGRPIETFKIPAIHWEKSRSWAGYEYCMKDDTHVGERWTKGVPPPLIVPKVYGWQEEVLEIIKQEPDDRTIYWFWEPDGKAGKSALARYLAIKEKALVVDGKGADIKASIALMKEKPRIIVMDIPRCVEHISYNAIECVKNGVFFSGKYESGMVMMNYPHFICFSNIEPDREKLSGDRWVIKRIEVI